MKKFSFILLLIFMIVSVYSQQSLLYEEEIIGNSWYDLQSNGSSQNRLYVFEDGIIGATWTLSVGPSSSYPDRGTGYNYFDGINWQDWPTERIESDRTGWPSYAPWGEEGEIVLAHYSGADYDGLVFSSRPDKGTGEWSHADFFGPPGHEGLLWPRMVTGGDSHERIYLIALSRPTTNGGEPYQGLDGALLYSLSTDGGQSWSIQNEILPGMDSTLYDKITGDYYAWAEPQGDVVAFVTGSWEHDLFIMKSTDGGLTFQKTIIWDNPWNSQTTGNSFYCPDGSMHAVIDNSGKVHVAFAVTSVTFSPADSIWYHPDSVDGIVYWNEAMETFSENPNALNPNLHPESELVIDYNLIGYMQDINGDGQLSLAMENGLYANRGISTWPQIVIDNLNRLFLVYSSVTETYDNVIQNYRRIWIRSSLNGGASWGPFYHFAEDDSTSIFTEYSFPSCAANSDDHIYMMYQKDNEPGLDIFGPGKKMWEQQYGFAKISKEEIVGLGNDVSGPIGFLVSQNTPNPFSGSTNIEVSLSEQAQIHIRIFTLTGTDILKETLQGTAGKNIFTIRADRWKPGIYFYTISTGEKSITKKMIVQ